ncbi:GIY-YIG nuclease family protein [Syntrophus aciditrophicus]|uniref:UPF0213 protein SYNAS_10430 n=1 Tax=Syntrophus aciditrophicus (strain SB) TaxID=56780 RepID=Y1043_SYNAS|nr:GIY-YIG nuclease family protein [Syntrophus aciditrophicus]Q2LS66.1 RecName: Full=UPF0213 protein SYNAS_10430 [Syntrophus aciditrophicus SB]ABC76922.1 predicted endonuclease containing a URI domain [Syntrophus aciditrophicus SB]OPY17427.1 MAG: GIY-YIG nuclease superfamily protein [Syntrophus sp. PtaB.Bin075]
MSKNYVYILECSDKTLYTGWTVNIEKRLQEHNSGKYGAKYTKSRRPVKLVHLEMVDSLSGVLKREAQIKKMSRAEKLQLIKQNPERM